MKTSIETTPQIRIIKNNIPPVGDFAPPNRKAFCFTIGGA
jgi:hypothetical protein